MRRTLCWKGTHHQTDNIVLIVPGQQHPSMLGNSPAAGDYVGLDDLYRRIKHVLRVVPRGYLVELKKLVQ